MFPLGQPNRQSGRSIASNSFWTELTQSTGGSIFTFLGAHNRSPPISSIPRSTSVQQRHRVQNILPNSIRMYMLSNDRLLARSQEPAPIRKRLRQRPDDESTAHPAYILELPSELMNIIMSLIIDDPKALSSTRATCRLLKQITQHDFCRIHITEMKNLSTKALERLVWTSLQPSLAPWISSITVDFHNSNLLLSSVLKASNVPGIVDFHMKDDAPLISPW